jgi:hypothetical protein
VGWECHVMNQVVLMLVSMVNQVFLLLSDKPIYQFCQHVHTEMENLDDKVIINDSAISMYVN